MADEISISYSASVVNGNFTDGIQPRTTQYDMNAIEKFDNIIATSTSETNLTLTGITTPSLIIVENLDSSIAIQFGKSVGGAMEEFARIGARCAIIITPLSGATYRYRSVSGTPKMWVRAWG